MSYWSERQKQLYAELEKDEIKLKKRLSSFYDAEKKRLEKEISSFYARYGENNIIEYRKLLEKLSDGEMKLLMQDMDEFAKQYPQYAHLLPVRANVYKLDRLEGLQYTVMLQQLEIGAKNNTEITKHLLRQAHRSVNAVQETMGFGKNFYAMNSDIVKSFVNVPWSNGSNFSDKVWVNSNKLASYLNTDIAQGFARGDSYEKLVKQVCDRFEHVVRKDAYRLVYTEGTYVMAESSIKPFERDYEQYKISTASDGKVCKLCSDMAQQVFNIKDRVPGRNFPPFHPWCRCTFEIVVEDWEKWIDDYVKKHRVNPPDDMLKKISDNDIMIPAGKSPYSNKELIYNPNAAYNADIKGLSRVVNNGLSNACRQVAEQGYTDGKEHLAMVDLQTGNIVYTETGLSSQVGGGAFWQFVRENPDGSFAFVHNHNTPTQFSEADLLTLTDKNCVNMFVVSRYDGKIFVIESNGLIRSKSFFEEIYAKEIDEINKKVKSGEYTSGDRTYQREKMIVENAIKDFTKGLIQYG